MAASRGLPADGMRDVGITHPTQLPLKAASKKTQNIKINLT